MEKRALSKHVVDLERLFKIGVISNLEAIVTTYNAAHSDLCVMDLARMMSGIPLEERILVLGAVEKHMGEERSRMIERANRVILGGTLNRLTMAIKTNTYREFLSGKSSRELVELSRIIASKEPEKISDMDTACLRALDECIAAKMTDERVPDVVDKAIEVGRIDEPKGFGM